jgi:hypothetical protein
MSYEDAFLRATQKPPHPDSSWKAIRFSSGMRPRDVRQGTAPGFHAPSARSFGVGPNDVLRIHKITGCRSNAMG